VGRAAPAVRVTAARGIANSPFPPLAA
jgi:hypothetical protein